MALWPADSLAGQRLGLAAVEVPEPGGIHPAEPGHYVADYGDLGSVEFTVT